MSLPEGLFDVHVHSSPDIEARWGGDLDVVTAYEAAGAAGVVLKNHYESTVGRAAVAGADRGIAVYGGLVLNSQAGGFNPAAVAAALQMGARLIWMPTQDAHTQHAAGLPSLRRLRPELPAVSYAAPPVNDVARNDLRLVLRLIAEYDAVLATGHLGRSECEWLVHEAREAGVQRILLTHAGWAVPNIDAESAQRLAGTGALVEITAFQLVGSHPIEPAVVARFARTVGLGNVVLSSDAGQAGGRTPPDALGLLIETLAHEGLPEDALVRSASSVPQGLVAP